MSKHTRAVGGPLVTRVTLSLGLVALVGFTMIGWRFISGLGATTALNDGYPWGLWIAMDVVTGTALACGGYAVALLTYLFNQGRYHPIVRPAILTSLFGYAMGGFGVIIDLGRYWNVYKVFWPEYWNLNSVLLEVALCITTYIFVLFAEIAPAFCERGESSKSARVRYLSRKLWVFLERSLLFLIALGLLLPTMHQSSLGSLLLVAGSKVHALWYTPMLPILFLLSCLAIGFGVVIFEASLSSRVFGNPSENKILARIAVPVAVCLGLFVALRLIDLLTAGKWALIASSGLLSLLFLLEMLLFIGGATMLWLERNRARTGALMRAALVIILAGALYRFDAFLIAYDPGPGWSYFPAIPEQLATLGLLAFEILLYVVVVRLFPIFTQARRSA